MSAPEISGHAMSSGGDTAATCHPAVLADFSARADAIERMAIHLCEHPAARRIAGQEYAASYADSERHVQCYWLTIAAAALAKAHA